ncbi:hypothetical protein JCM6882_005426 [Rhodosporidiobolus microsporus]
MQPTPNEASNHADPHPPAANSPGSSAAGLSLQHSPEHTPEPDERSEHGRGGDDERDELDDDADEAASTSTDRARSLEPVGSSSVPSADGAAPSVGDVGRTIPPGPGKTQAAFVHKLYAMLETPSLAHLISWSEDGKSFIIYHPSEFARIVLPQYFKHSNFSSFIRQGNFYHFSKISDVPGTPVRTAHTNPDGTPVQTWEFRNPNFQRGRPDLLARIKRKTAKSNANPSPSSIKRRSSVTALTSLRPARRESIVSLEQEYEQERERERQAERPIIGGLAGAAMAASGVTRPARVEYAVATPEVPQPKRIAPGLADFAPYPPEDARRVKEEPVDAPSATHSPPLHSRAVPHPPGIAPYPPANPSYSPTTRAYPTLPPTSYPGLRYPASEDPLVRQIQALEGQVRGLGEALYATQHEAAVYRTNSYAVLHSLLGLVASMDPDGRRKEEVEACSFALAKLSPEASPSAQAHPPTFAYAPPYGYPPPGWSAAYPFGAPPTSLLHSPRPSTSASQQFYYNRVPAVESYTRSSRGEPAPAAHHPAPAPPPAQRSRAPSFSGHVPGSVSSGSTSSAHPSATPHTFDKPSAPSSSTLPPIGRPSDAHSSFSSSGPLSGAYPSPRLSWAGAGPGPVSRPGSSGAEMGPGPGKASTTLPPLSSLLNPAGPPPSFSSSSERRTLDGELDDERARKKLRQ